MRRLVLAGLGLVFGVAGALAQDAPEVPVPATQQSPAQKAVPLQGVPDQATPDQGPLPTIVLRADLVNLVFTVTNKNGQFVTGLQRGQFGLLDNGFPPAGVVAFTQLTNLPLRVGVMLDTSSSIRSRFKFEQDSAVDFFLQVLRPVDRAFVEGFDAQLYLSQDYTANISKLDDGIRKLRPGGSTSLFDALYKTCQGQMLSLKEPGSVRKALIVVSDGEDNFSHSGIQDAVKMCQRAETIVYTISTDTSPDHGSGGDVLRTISNATGGRAFFPVKLEDVALGFQAIENELRSQYSLEYVPSHFKQDGSFRTILLQSTDERYSVRARTGYFAPRAPGMADLAPETPAKTLSKAQQKELAKANKKAGGSALQ